MRSVIISVWDECLIKEIVCTCGLYGLKYAVVLYCSHLRWSDKYVPVLALWGWRFLPYVYSKVVLKWLYVYSKIVLKWLHVHSKIVLKWLYVWLYSLPYI